MFLFPSVQNERQQRIVDVERNRQSMISLKLVGAQLMLKRFLASRPFIESQMTSRRPMTACPPI
eukprot:scaffold5704_cov120-Chaetoceros_neogracile.AAC.1